MTDFTKHTMETAPEESRPLLENSQKAFGRLPGLHAVMAEAPALLETNDEWTVARRYMSLETLARVNDNPKVRSPVVVP